VGKYPPSQELGDWKWVKVFARLPNSFCKGSFGLPVETNMFVRLRMFVLPKLGLFVSHVGEKVGVNAGQELPLHCHGDIAVQCMYEVIV